MNSSIGGEQNPTIGKEYNYFITDMLDVNLTITNEVSTYIWHIYVKLKNGKIVDITKDGGKIGSEVPYSFSEKAINKEYILVVNRATKKLLSTDYKFEKIAEFHIFPTTSTEIKIEKVILFNKGAKDVNKASYTDTLVARAYCIGMVNKEIEFQLWEDDAKGKGHDAAINKNNTDSKFIFKATVNQKGIAEVKIPLSSDPKLLQKIANKYLMAGDKTEGANHEYYVTASYLGDIKGASQVNVDVKNPDNNKTQNAPKKESAIFPVDKGVAKPDINKKIINAYFADKNNKRITKVIVGTQLYVVIHTNSMVDKYIQYVIWEKDSSGNHDPIHRSNRLKVTGNLMSIKSIFVTKNIFEKGIDFSLLDPDAEKQNYYIEVIAPDLEAKSRHFGVTLETGLLEVEKTKSVVVVAKQERKKEETTCVCMQYDLIWGNKVSCEFRKKVVEICAELWGEDRKKEMANGLMAVINVETSGSFKAHHREEYRSANDNPKDLTVKSFHKDGDSKSSRAIGLIQFTQEALEGMGEFPKSTKENKGTQERYDALNKLKLSYAQMGEIKQLDKVKKYFEPSKNKVKTPEDIYLQIFAPIGVGKSDDSTLYRKYDNPKNDAEKASNTYYKANESVDTGSTGKNKSDGIVQRSEILERYHKSKKEGSNNKASNYTCSISNKKEEPKITDDVVTYHIYANGTIEKHIPKKIKSGYEDKYKYVYHDKNDTEHEICIVEWHRTTKKLPSKTKLYSKPTHSKIISDKNIDEGQTKRRVIYENGDIAEYGSNDGDTFWRLYKSTSENIELVKMPEKVNYVSYSFSGTKRQYTGPNYFAGFLGAFVIFPKKRTV